MRACVYQKKVVPLQPIWMQRAQRAHVYAFISRNSIYAE